MAQQKSHPFQKSEEAPVSSEEYPEFHRLLLSRREEILSTTQAARANLDDQLVQAPGDEADLSVQDTSTDYFARLAHIQQRKVFAIDQALDRMNRGVYGTCESCERAIAAERLRKIPEARLCIDCQSMLEKNQLAKAG